MINTNLFRAACLARGKTPDELARLFGIDTDSFNRKVREGRFKLDETDKLVKALNLNTRQATQVFLPDLYRKEHGDEYDDEIESSFFSSLQKEDQPPPAQTEKSFLETSDENTLSDCVTVYDREDARAHYKTIRVEDVLAPSQKEFYFVEDFMEMTGQGEGSCRKLMQRIKRVSDVMGVITAVHRVDYVKYIQYQLDRNVHRGPYRKPRN